MLSKHVFLRTLQRRMAVKKTIFALSSGSLPSAIAIIRISGTESEDALRKLTRRTNFIPMQMFYTKIFTESGELLDRAMACFMRGPKTFTGEDSAELYLHGSRAVVNAVSATLSKMQNIQSAKAGEFTKRAFFNGKMDIWGVRALSSLISAETDSQLRQSHAAARTGEYLRPLREKLFRLVARMEASIDFAEDVGHADDDPMHGFEAEIEKISRELRGFLRSAQRGALIQSGVRIALVGRTNVGKSSIINRLAEKDLAIVSDISGTTRDCVETRLQLNSFLVYVADTAGLRTTADVLESEGIRRTVKKAEDAHIVVLVVDVSRIQDQGNIARAFANEMEFLRENFRQNEDAQQIIVCLNKADLIDSEERKSSILKELSYCCPHPLVWTSCLRENGLAALIDSLGNLLDTSAGDFEGNELGLNKERHIECLEMALEHLGDTAEALELNDPAIAAYHIRLCADMIGEISGTIVNEQILDQVFSQFCIGK